MALNLTDLLNLGLDPSILDHPVRGVRLGARGVLHAERTCLSGRQAARASDVTSQLLGSHTHESCLPELLEQLPAARQNYQLSYLTHYLPSYLRARRALSVLPLELSASSLAVFDQARRASESGFDTQAFFPAMDESTNKRVEAQLNALATLARADMPAFERMVHLHASTLTLPTRAPAGLELIWSADGLPALLARKVEAATSFGEFHVLATKLVDELEMDLTDDVLDLLGHLGLPDGGLLSKRLFRAFDRHAANEFELFWDLLESRTDARVGSADPSLLAFPSYGMLSAMVELVLRLFPSTRVSSVVVVALPFALGRSLRPALSHSQLVRSAASPGEVAALLDFDDDTSPYARLTAAVEAVEAL